MYKVILIDDEYLIKKKLRSIIDWEQYEMEVVADFDDGNEAIEFLRKNRVDLIITDIRMTYVSGIGVAEYVYKHCPETIVVFLSAYNDVEYAKFGMKYGVKNYLNKPISKNKFCMEMEGIKEYLDSVKVQKQSFDFSLYTNFFNSIISDENISDLQKEEIQKEKYNFCKFDLILKNGDINDKITRALYNIFHFLFKDLYFCILYHDLKMYKIAIFSKKHIHEGWSDEYCSSIKENLMLDVVINNIKHFNNLNMIEGGIVSDHIRKNQKTDKTVEKIKEYIGNNLAGDVSLDKIAESVFLSPSHASKHFKKITGINISEYIMEKRLEMAKLLLLTTDLPINEIIEKVGYTAEPYFYTLFKKRTGMSPLQFRNRE